MALEHAVRIYRENTVCVHFHNLNISALVIFRYICVVPAYKFPFSHSCVSRKIVSKPDITCEWTSCLRRSGWREIAILQYNGRSSVPELREREWGCSEIFDGDSLHAGLLGRILQLGHNLHYKKHR